MKKFQFISRFAASVAAVALTLGSVVSFTACSDDDEIDNSGIKSRLEVPTVNAVSAETDITKTSLTFSWEAVGDATGYQAQIRYSETGDIVREQISENTTVTFENLNSGTEYFFRVCATYKYDEGRNSAYSAYVSAKTEEADPTRPTFAVPAEVRCNMGATTAESLTFTWESVEGAQKYNVLLTAIGEDDRTFETTGTSYTFNGLTTGVKYFFSVQVAEIPGEAGTNASDWSGAVKATTTARLTTPQNLQLKVKMAQAAQFVWDEVEGAKTYQYELITLTPTGSTETVLDGLMSDVGANFTPGATVYATSTANNSISFLGLEKKSYYAFRVKAVAAADQTEQVDSEFTDQYVFRTLEFDPRPLGLPKFKLDEAQQLKLIFSWPAVAEAFGYDYQIATPDDVKDGNEAAYVTGQIRAANPGEAIATTLTVKDFGKDADGKTIPLTIKTAYKFRMKSIADPDGQVYGDSSWSEWLDVNTVDLVSALTIKDGEDISDLMGRVKDGAVITLQAGSYNTTARFTISQSVTIQGENAADRPKVNFSNFAIDPQAACGKIRIANIEFTNFKLNDDGTLNNTEYQGQYFIDFQSTQKAHVDILEVENCVVWGGFKSAFIRMNRSNFGADNLVVKNNIICVGGSDGGLIGANGKPIGKDWTITGNTIDAMGSLYGNTKFSQIVRFPNGNGEGFVGKIENNTFYNLSIIKGKDLFEAPQGQITVSKNIVTIDTSATGAWTKNIGIKAALTSTNNFIYDTTSTLEGFTVADPQITGYKFLENYKPTNADVIAAGAGDPRWLQ